MSKKLPISVTPLVATVALVALPAVAQATPHYYSDETKIEEGVKVPTFAWGHFFLTNSARPTEPVECENETAGFVENPSGGGAGKGETNASTVYNCDNTPDCESGGGTIAVLMENEATPGLVTSLKWPSKLVEGEKIRVQSTNVREYLRCHIVSLAPEETLFEKGPAFLRTTTEIEAGGIVCTTNEAEGGAQKPALTNGTDATKPSKLVSVEGEASGQLACRSKNPERPTEESSSKQARSGTLKMMGYAEGETITAKR